MASLLPHQRKSPEDCTMTPQHAKELLPIIQACSEGKQIQVRADRTEPWEPLLEDIFYGAFEYRIKPEKRVAWVNIYVDSSLLYVCPTKEEADKQGGCARIACIRVEYEEGEGI